MRSFIRKLQDDAKYESANITVIVNGSDRGFVTPAGNFYARADNDLAHARRAATLLGCFDKEHRRRQVEMVRTYRTWTEHRNAVRAAILAGEK